MRIGVRVFALCLLVAMGAASRSAHAAHLTVNCDKKETIREALRFLSTVNPHGPNTLVVSGNCNENVVIQSMDRLTLIAKRGASISDHSDGALAVVDIEDSRSVTVQGFTINGGGSGVNCAASSVCYLTSNTVQDAVTVGVDASRGSHAFLESNVIQNSADVGAIVDDGSQMFSSNDIFQGNAALGVELGDAYFVATNSSFLNNGIGILAGASNLLFHGGTISGSVSDGMRLLAGSTAVFRDATTVTSNGGIGVHMEDASFAGFQNASVTGNLSGLDVDCAPQFTITHFVDRTGGITNCVEPAAAAQRTSMK